MRIITLGSGSKGNCTIVEAGNTRLMLDCGFGIRDAEKRCNAAGVDPVSLDAILITHEHQDHAGGVVRFAGKYGIPVHLTAGTWYVLKERSGKDAATLAKFEKVTWCQLASYQSFTIGNITVNPLPVPHDAKEPCQFTFQAAGKKLGVLTDLGMITPHVLESYQNCDGLFLECNHDLQML